MINSLQRMLFVATLLFVTYSIEAQTMTFDSGGEPGFSYSGWVASGGILYPASPNVNGQATITVNEGCWDLVSFEAYYFLPGGGTWRASSNLGHEHFFTISASPSPIVLNWESITTLTLQLIDPGNGIPNNTFDFDNVVYNLPNLVSPDMPVVTFDPTPVCPNPQFVFNIAGNVNDGLYQIKRLIDGVFVFYGNVYSGNITVDPGETTTYSVQGIVPGGCAPPTETVVFTVEVLTASTPFTGYSITPGGPIVECSGQVVTMEATGGVDGDGAVTRWYTGPDGTGVVYGVGNPLTIVVQSDLLYYPRREGTCNSTTSIPMSITLDPDPNPPVITCPPAVNISNTVGPCDAAALDIGNATATDACTYTISNDAPALFPLGETIVTWTAIDNYDDQSTCIQTVNYACCIAGCDDVTACNYDENVTCDDGSCIYTCSGCTYPSASNYDPIFSDDDGSCIFTGCTDPSFTNYNPYANVDDGSCANNGGGTCQGDLNVDTQVNGADLVIFLSQFGSSCN